MDKPKSARVRAPKRVAVTPRSWIGVSVTARILETSPDTVLNLIEDGSLDAYQLRKGGWWRVDRDSLRRYMNRLDEESDS